MQELLSYIDVLDCHVRVLDVFKRFLMLVLLVLPQLLEVCLLLCKPFASDRQVVPTLTKYKGFSYRNYSWYIRTNIVRAIPLAQVTEK